MSRCDNIDGDGGGEKDMRLYSTYESSCFMCPFPVSL